MSHFCVDCRRFFSFSDPECCEPRGWIVRDKPGYEFLDVFLCPDCTRYEKPKPKPEPIKPKPSSPHDSEDDWVSTTHLYPCDDYSNDESDKLD